ncbi:MAG: S24 family peptidase [Bacteroidales bacterium]
MNENELRHARLKTANAHLEVRGLTLKQLQLADKIGYHKSSVSSAFGGNPKYLTNTFLKKYNAVYDNIFNIDWLINGNGSMLHINSEESFLIEDGYGIPYYSDEAFCCGSPEGFSNALTKSNPSGYISFPGIEPSSDTFIVKAHGDSMINRENPSKSITDGTWVALRKLDKSNFRWGEVYAIATTSGYLIKRITQSETDGFIRCESFNIEDNYTAFDISVIEIFDVAQVIGTANFKRWA